MKLTSLEPKLYLIKFFILGLVALFIFSPGENQHWPFVYWELYDSGNPYIPKEISRVELRVLDSNLNWHSVKIEDLYTLDDDSSAQPGGNKIIKKAFLENPQNWPIYRSYLLEHLGKKLNIEIKLIEAYRLTWKLDYEEYPPLDINRPNQMTKIDSFKASDYINQ